MCCTKTTHSLSFDPHVALFSDSKNLSLSDLWHCLFNHCSNFSPSPDHQSSSFPPRNKSSSDKERENPTAHLCLAPVVWDVSQTPGIRTPSWSNVPITSEPEQTLSTTSNSSASMCLIRWSEMSLRRLASELPIGRTCHHLNHPVSAMLSFGGLEMSLLGAWPSERAITTVRVPFSGAHTRPRNLCSLFSPQICLPLRIDAPTSHVWDCPLFADIAAQVPPNSYRVYRMTLLDLRLRSLDRFEFSLGEKSLSSSSAFS